MNCQKWKTGLLSGLMRIGYLRPSDKKWLQVKKVWMEIREGMELLCTIEASSSIINSYLLLFYLVHFFLFLPRTFLLFFSFYFVKRDPVYPTHWYIHERDVAFLASIIHFHLFQSFSCWSLHSIISYIQSVFIYGNAGTVPVIGPKNC